MWWMWRIGMAAEKLSSPLVVALGAFQVWRNGLKTDAYLSATLRGMVAKEVRAVLSERDGGPPGLGPVEPVEDRIAARIMKECFGVTG
jgi:hypothetical protein